jgi:hypothetical protein
MIISNSMVFLKVTLQFGGGQQKNTRRTLSIFLFNNYFVVCIAVLLKYGNLDAFLLSLIECVNYD